MAGTPEPGSEGSSTRRTGLKVTLEPIVRPSDLGRLWCDLEQRSDCTFFQSWAWVGCWLRQLPPHILPRVLTVSDGPVVVGLGVLVVRRTTRHGILRISGLHLNETGDPRIDPLSLEYNGFLADRRVGVSVVVRHCLAWFAKHQCGWEELNLGGLCAATANEWSKITDEIGLRSRVWAEKRCDYVDLSDLRQNGADYLGSLTRNTRYQIRRAMRLYEATGPLEVTAARNTNEAIDFLGGLCQLHQSSWVSRGHAGAFANEFFDRFHGELVASCFDSGQIQLLRVHAGPSIVGYLYNLVKDGEVYAYQSGLNYGSDQRLKPGLVSHTLAIQYNLAQGTKTYNFMAGEAQHKKALGTNVEYMTWLVIYRGVMTLRFENAIRVLKARLKGLNDGNAG